MYICILYKGHSLTAVKNCVYKRNINMIKPLKTVNTLILYIGFKEFYNQRRRWTPSTMANILDLLSDWRVITRNNDNVSIPYICLQLSWFVSSILTPGVLLLMIIGATNLAYPQLSLHAALLINLLPVVLFVIVCFFAKTEHQVQA
jgi:chitin synthase